MAASDISQSTNRTPSFFVSIWRRYLARRARNRARFQAQVRFRLTREGIHFLGILLFIFIGAVIREINLLILLAGSMLGLLLLQWRFNTRTLLKLSLDRKTHKRTRVDASSEIELTIHNPKYWLGAWLVMVEDLVQKQQPEFQRVADKGIAVADEVRPQSSARCRYKLAFHERGRYQIGPSTISTRFPIGLGRGSRTLDNATEIIVHPRIGELTTSIGKLFQENREGQASKSPKSGMHEAEFYGLRPWESGDSKRWIHWRTSARLGELSVRQFERQQQRELCLLVDLYAPAGKNSSQKTLREEVEHCEKAISFAATLATRTSLQGSNKLAVSVAGKSLFSASRIQSAVMVNSLLDELAVAAPDDAPDLEQAIRSLTLPLTTNPVLLVISTRPSQTDRIQESLLRSSSGRLLSRTKINWLDISNGDLEPYFAWTTHE